MIEFFQAAATLIALFAAWLALGAVGAWIQLKADGSRDGLETFAGRAYFGLMAICGPIAIPMGLGSALGAALSR